MKTGRLERQTVKAYPERLFPVFLPSSSSDRGRDVVINGNREGRENISPHVFRDFVLPVG